MDGLAKKKCVPCVGGGATLETRHCIELLKELHSDWHVTPDSKHLIRTFKTNNFSEALSLTNRVGEIAETENHHPELTLGWGHLEVEIWSHKVGALTESDFILAAKIDQLIL